MGEKNFVVGEKKCVQSMLNRKKFRINIEKNFALIYNGIRLKNRGAKKWKLEIDK